MPKYTVQDTSSGKKVTFDWNDANPPTDADMEQVFSEARKPDAPATSGSGLTAMSFVRPALEIGGMTAGGVLGSPAGPIGTVGGAGLGYGAGKGIADLIEGKPQPSTVGGALLSGAKDVATGATMEMGGQVAGKAIGGAISGIGKLGKAVVGKFTGAGSSAAEEAVRGSKAFTDAMRGKVSGDEIVQNAKDALGVIKSNRAKAYTAQLEELGKIRGDIDTAPIGEKTISLMEKYGVKVKTSGKEVLRDGEVVADVNGVTFDFSRSPIDKRGQKDVENALGIIRDWGNQPGDKTPAGLDILKRRLDDAYTESSNARGFIAELRNTVKELLIKEVPQYKDMMKGYSEATTLIKDIESGLMLRKQGMTGRIVADQTLRRLTSAMRDNFQLRKELLGVLADQGGADLMGQTAGYSMSALLPHGLQGVGASLAGTAAALQYINPKFAPFIVLSSPRVAGEFLRMLGKATKTMPGTGVAASKAAAYLTVPPAQERMQPQLQGLSALE